MEIYRCQICGEAYMGSGKPGNCPYCGAAQEYLVLAEDWIDENQNIGQLSEASQANLEKALKLEVNNAPFYRDALSKTADATLQAAFKYLAAIEDEHASTVRKILGWELPLPDAGETNATDSDSDNLSMAHGREVTATAFYRQAADEAPEPRVKKVFTALAGIESDHVVLEERLQAGR